MITELAAPVANWIDKTSGQRVQDIASIALEWQGKTNVFWVTLSQLSRLTDTNKTEGPVYFKENTATIETLQWASFSDAEYLAWISSEKEGFYKSSRVSVSKKYTDGREVRILTVEACLKLDGDQCVKLYEAFTGKSDTGLDPEDFRDRPVEFNLPEGTTFDDLVQVLTRKTLALLTEEKQKAVKDGAEIEQENAVEIHSARTEYQQIFVGARIEDELIKRGHAIRGSMGCPGVSNREARAMLQADFNSGLGEFEFKNPDRYGAFSQKSICNKCGQEKMVCPPPRGCGVCRDCQINFDLGIYQ